MKIKAAVISFTLDGDHRSYETSGTLFNSNLILLSGTALIGFLHRKNWISSFVKSVGPKLQPNEHIQKINFRVYRNKGDEIYFSECKAIGAWKSVLVTKSAQSLFSDWSLGTSAIENELENPSIDDIDLSKELMSIFILLKCKSRGEPEQNKETNNLNDDIRELVNFKLSLQTPSRGQEVEIISTPFGNRNFINSLSRGIISNVLGYENCIILTDAKTVSCCEGGPIFLFERSSKREKKANLLGIVTCPLTWWRNEWVGLTIGISLISVLKEFSSIYEDITKYTEPTNIQHIIIQDSPLLKLIDETVVLVQCNTSWGSGFVLNAVSGIIITCSHVVKKDVAVSVFYKGKEYPAEIIFQTKDDVAYDLAVLKVKRKRVFRKEVSFSQKSPEIGESVIAAGFPFFPGKEGSDIKASVVAGCISRISPYMIQTTCCIQSGFSGGPLFRDNELLGVIVSNTKDLTAGALYPHINYIIPTSAFEKIVLKYIKTGDPRCLQDLESTNQKVQSVWQLHSSKL